MKKTIFSDDFALVEAIKNGDQRAFNQLYNEHYEKMLTVAKNYAQDTPQAEDIVQDAFVKIEKYLKIYDLRSSIIGLAIKTVRATGIEYYRQRKNTASFIDVDTVIGPLYCSLATDYEFKEELKRFEHVLFKKAPKQLKVALLHAHGYSHSEIANILSISQGTSKSQLCRFRQKIVVLRHAS